MSNSTNPHPSHDAIVERSHKLWIAAGRPQNQELDHWLLAEKQLKEEAPPPAKNEVIDLESDTAYGNIDSISPLGNASKPDEVIPDTFTSTKRSKGTTSL